MLASNAVARYAHSATIADDVGNLFAAALELRHGCRGDGHTPDLEFIPVECCGSSVGTGPPPRLGRFTLLYSSFDFPRSKPWLSMRKCVCGKDNVTGGSSSPVRLAVLALEAPTYRPTWQPPAPTVSLDRPYMPLPAPGGVLSVHQIPYTSFAHWDGAALPEAPPPASRPALAALFASTAFAGRADNLRVNGTVGGALRMMLAAQCAAAPRGQCLMPRAAASAGAIAGGVVRTGNNNLGAFPAEEALVAYRRATFCLQPWGDTATRKAYWDALAVGCINVVFHEAGWNGTDGWYGDHRRVSVRVPMAHWASVLSYLSSIPQHEVARLHTEVMRVRGRCQYALAAGTPGGDAVDIALGRLRGAWQASAPPSEFDDSAAAACAYSRLPDARHQSPIMGERMTGCPYGWMYERVGRNGQVCRRSDGSHQWKCAGRAWERLSVSPWCRKRRPRSAPRSRRGKPKPKPGNHSAAGGGRFRPK